MSRELKQEMYEDIAAISAFIRRNAFIYGTDLADRLDAAWKRQMSQSWHHREMEELIAKHEKEIAELKKQTGNAAAMREALEAINRIETRGLKYLLMQLVEADIYDGGLINKTISAIEKARRALSAPARNCDFYDNKTDAETRFVEETGENDTSQHYWQMFAIWLFAFAAERKGDCDGR